MKNQKRVFIIWNSELLRYEIAGFEINIGKIHSACMLAFQEYEMFKRKFMGPNTSELSRQSPKDDASNCIQ